MSATAIGQHRQLYTGRPAVIKEFIERRARRATGIQHIVHQNHRLADDINIKRKAVYAERAQANGATIEEYAFSAGCQAIARTVPGEKYQAPDGSWQTRTAAAPLRDPRCP